jgi:hypothetical protein
MKNILLFPIIFAFIFSACSDFSGNEDAVEASLKPGPVTQQQQEESEPTREYYDLNGITFGNNTFVAVGKTGTVRTSSDNGTTWDNGTSGTKIELNEIAYGDSTFVSVGQSGTTLYSSNNGTSWSAGTCDECDHLTGVAYGDNTFIGVASTYVIKSTDNGSNWNKKGAGVRVVDVAFGNSNFVGCGAIGAILFSDNNGDGWETGDSDASSTTFSSITFGNNQFFSVGNRGKLIKATDNFSDWTNVDSTVPKNLSSIVIGNNTFVAVGYKTVIVSTDNGSNFTVKEDEYTFNDVTYGNGVFVAVGDDEKIYTSTDDGDTWTKVHGE